MHCLYVLQCILTQSFTLQSGVFIYLHSFPLYVIIWSVESALSLIPSFAKAYLAKAHFVIGSTLRIKFLSEMLILNY